MNPIERSVDRREIRQNGDQPSMSLDESNDMIFIGLEIGGTNLKAGIILEDGKCSDVKVERLAKDSSAREPEALVDNLIALGQSILDERGITWQEIRRIGIACPGQIKSGTGIVVAASNFPTWTNVPLAGLVQERTGRPATVLNDASAAAAAEFASRASHGNIAVLTLGTGVGLGVVQSGHLMVGTRGLIEGGHMVIEPGPDGRSCPCGQRGCLEAYASASAVVKIASERIQCHALSRRGSAPPIAACEVGKGHEDVSSVRSKPVRPERRASHSAVADRIRELERKSSGGEASMSLPNAPSSTAAVSNTGDAHVVEHGGASPRSEPGPIADVNVNKGGIAITSEEVFARAGRGDRIAMRVVDETCNYIGIACINICRMLDPAAILLTGGLSRAEGLVDKVREAFANRGWKVLPHGCEIALASTSGSSSSGVLGAAYAAMSDYAREVRTQEARQVPSANPNDVDRASSESAAGASRQENSADRASSESAAGASRQENNADRSRQHAGGALGPLAGNNPEPDNLEYGAANSERVSARESNPGPMASTALFREGPFALTKTADPSRRKRSDEREMGWLVAGIGIGAFIGFGVCYGARAFGSTREGIVRAGER